MAETKRKKDLFDIVSGLENLMISANRAADLLEILDEGLTEEIEGAAKDDPVFRHLPYLRIYLKKVAANTSRS